MTLGAISLMEVTGNTLSATPQGQPGETADPDQRRSGPQGAREMPGLPPHGSLPRGGRTTSRCESGSTRESLAHRYRCPMARYPTKLASWEPRAVPGSVPSPPASNAGPSRGPIGPPGPDGGLEQVSCGTHLSPPALGQVSLALTVPPPSTSWSRERTGQRRGADRHARRSWSRAAAAPSPSPGRKGFGPTSGCGPSRPRSIPPTTISCQEANIVLAWHGGIEAEGIPTKLASWSVPEVSDLGTKARVGTAGSAHASPTTAG
jgi:hypothetical protein